MSCYAEILSSRTDNNIMYLPWRRDAVVIASALSKDDPGSNPARVKVFQRGDSYAVLESLCDIHTYTDK
jgi:hypothetical protein